MHVWCIVGELIVIRSGQHGAPDVLFLNGGVREGVGNVVWNGVQ